MARYEGFFLEHWSVLQQAPLFHPESNPTFRNPTFEAAAFRALIVRLSPFRDVNRSTPHLFLFQAIRRAAPGAYVDMAFFPPEHDRERLLDAGVPLLVGTQSWHDVRDFDVVLISNAYTLELINLPYLLIHSGIPLFASQRAAAPAGEGWPPMILGGSNAMASQALVTPEQDAVVDALFFGEGERQVETLIAHLAARERHPDPNHHGRERLLAAAEAMSGLWVANGPPDQVVDKAICYLPQAQDLLVDYPVLNSEEATTARLQTSFGCPSFCSFCFEGYDRKPYREVALDEVLEVADRLKRTQGVEALDIYSFNFNTHEEILSLLLDLNRRFDRVNVLSQRLDLLAVMPSLVEAEVQVDKRSFTLGIEGVSRRTRAFLHKSLSDAEIETVMVRLMRERIREIKLFYILTGHEDAADLAEFHRFVLQLKAWRQSYSRGLRVVFSFGLLIRMPFTPLRYDRLMLEEADWRQIIGTVKASCETNGFEFRLATTWDEYASTQVLALGGTWLHEAVVALAQEGHFYDLHLTPGYWEELRRWMVEREYWCADFLGEKPADWPYALDFVRSRVPGAFLYEQYRQALAGVDQGYCLGEVGDPAAVGKPGTCLGCGACTTPEERAAILHHSMRHPGTDYLAQLEQTMRKKWQTQPIYARVWLPPVVATAEPAWVHAFVMRSLLEAYPDLAETLLAAQEAVFTTRANAGRYVGLFGETVVGLKAWDVVALGRRLGDAGVPDDGCVLPGGVRFLGLLEQFEPGAFRQMDLHLRLPLAHFPDAGRQLRGYLQAQYVPVNLRNVGVDGGPSAAYRFEIPEKARKKRVLLEGSYCESEGTFEADLTVTPKFDLVDYLRSFAGPARYREALAEVRRLVL